MKNSEQIPESFAIKHPIQKFTNNWYDALSFLVILDLDNFKVKYLNPVIKNYCGLDSQLFLDGEKDFYIELFHPEDYPLYIEHLISCKSLQKGKTKEIVIRLKDRFGVYTHFYFKDRLYNFSPNGEKNVLLSQVRIQQAQPPIEKPDNLVDILEQDSVTNEYNHLLNYIDEPYCIIEMVYNCRDEPVDFLFVETNPAFERKVNIKSIPGKTMRELMPDCEEHWLQRFGKVAITGKSLRFEECSKILNNEWFDIYVYKTEGELCRRVTLLFKNIHQQNSDKENIKKEFEEEQNKGTHELFLQNQLLQILFETSNLALAVCDTLFDKTTGEIIDFKFLQVNKVLQDLYLGENVLDQTYLEISNSWVEVGVFELFVQVMETGKVMDKEFFLNNKHYKNWFRITARSQNSLLLVSIENITQRKEEAHKLKEAMRFNKQLVQTSPNTILIINLDDFKVRYINQDLHTSTGLTKELIKNITLPEILEYLHPRDREKIMVFHRNILKNTEDEILETEFRLKTRKGDWEWFNARGKVFNRKDENWVEEYVLVVRNITDQKTTQRALINAEKLSIQGEVARTLAHELRNPLASIRMATDVLNYKLDDSHKENLGSYIDILTRSTKVLNNLVSNLMNASNYSPPVLQEIDLAECIDYALEQAADRIYLTGIKVVKNFEGPYNILADKERLNIALLNIIVNASEATNPNEGVIEISIKEHKTDFMLSITDNGHGLEQEQIERLFEAFYSNKASGAGIGLTSVKNILEEHDAQIEVISSPGKGTTFKIYFLNMATG